MRKNVFVLKTAIIFFVIMSFVKIPLLPPFFKVGFSIVSASEKPEIFVQMGHSSGVSSVAFSPDGKYVLSGSWDTTLKLWDAATGKEIRTFAGHTGAINSVAFSPDGKYILSGDDKKIMKLWNIAMGREIRTFEGHTASINSVAFSPDGKYALSGSYEGVGVDGFGAMKFWDVATGKEIRTFKGHHSLTPVSSVAFSPDGKYVLSGSWDTTLKLWDAATGREVKTFAGHARPVKHIDFSPDGRFVISGGDDDYIKLWDVATGREIRTFTGHTHGDISVKFSPDGKYAISGSMDQTVKLWDIETGAEIRTFRGHTNRIKSVTFSPDGKYALSSDWDGLIKLWDIAAGKEIRTFKGYAKAVWTMAVSPDGRHAVSSSLDKTINLWDIVSGTAVRTFKGHTDNVWALTFSADGRYILSGSKDKTVKLWETETGKEIGIFSGHKGGVSLVAISPDGRQILSASNDPVTSLKLWDFSTMRLKGSKDDVGNVLSLAVSPNGKRALIGGNISPWLLDLTTGTRMITFKGHTGGVESVAFSPDGKYALSGSLDDTMKLWDAATGREIRTFKRSSEYLLEMGDVLSVAFSPDGKYALSGTYDQALKLWDIETGEEVRSFKGHTGAVSFTAFSPDSKMVYSGSTDGTIRLWNVNDGREIVLIACFTDGEWVVITPEGYFNASENGAKHLNVRIGNNVYSIEQFYSKFYRPEIIKLALAGKELPKGETFGDIASKKPAPSVQILSPGAGAFIDKDSVAVTVRVIDSGGGIGDISIYLNGSQIANDTRGVTVKGKSSVNEKTMDFNIFLGEGNNEIKVIAFNKDGSMESMPASINVISKAVTRKPSLYAIVVGINEYKNKNISLKYAVSDAQAFAGALKTNAGSLFENIHIKLLTNINETTKEFIEKTFEDIRSRIRPQDLFVFYDASHGIVDVVNNEEQYFLLTSNVLFFSSTDIGTDALSQKKLARLIGNIPAEKKIIILDTCNAGKGGKEIQIALLQQTRGLTEATAIKILQKEIGSSVFSASSDSQQAIEGYNGHGLFTYVLIEGFNGKADENKDGYIQVHELGSYVKYNVVTLSEEIFKRQQTPLVETNAFFPVGKVK